MKFRQKHIEALKVGGSVRHAGWDEGESVKRGDVIPVDDMFRDDWEEPEPPARECMFCRTKDARVYHAGINTVCMGCSKCGVCGPSKITRQDAINGWNRLQELIDNGLWAEDGLHTPVNGVPRNG